MKKFIFCVLIFLSIQAFGSEKSYVTCTSAAPEFATLTVKQIITSENSQVSSTFRTDINSSNGVTSEYWQSGQLNLSSGSPYLVGLFKKGSKEIKLTIDIDFGWGYGKDGTGELVELDKNPIPLICHYLL